LEFRLFAELTRATLSWDSVQGLLQQETHQGEQTGVPIEMGCYGIGVSRLMAAIVEAKHDDNGLIWPFEVAPYKIMFLPLRVVPDASEVLQHVLNVLDAEVGAVLHRSFSSLAATLCDLRQPLTNDVPLRFLF
jgi:hypothetical protein